MPEFRTIDDADVEGKRVLVRVDLNVPTKDGKVSDPTASSGSRPRSPSLPIAEPRSFCSPISSAKGSA